METEANAEGGTRNAEVSAGGGGLEARFLVREFCPVMDHAMVSEWWRGHGWPVVAAAILPALGVVSYFTDRAGQPCDAAAGWLYMDNSGSGVCMLEWLVTNPAVGGKASVRGITAVVEFLKQRAAELNYGVMLTTCRQPALVRLMERNAFTKTDEGMTHLVHILRR